jgi:MtN3 and saliva related transmembrane protein
MDLVTVIGLAAAAFTTVSLFPQLVKSWRTRLKPTGDRALVTYSVLFCVGIFLWLVYGIYKVDAPMIVANSLSFLQGVVILVLQFRRPKLKTEA